jgi:hypothetical protein
MKRPNIQSIPAVAALAVLCGLLSGCSFSRQWSQAGKVTIPTDEITGRWQGTWKSDSSGHNDKLRCVVTKTDNQHYSALFHAKYKRVFSFGYEVPLSVTRDGAQWTFQGEADLGKLAGGRYTYDGFATPTNFHSRYDSKYDRGTFEMTRPKQ